MEHKIAIVPACGGMTGAYGGGVLSQMFDLLPSTDFLVAGSSGLHNAVSFVVKNPTPEDLWLKLARPEIFKMNRILRGKYPCDTQRLVNWHLDHIDIGRLFTAKTKVYSSLFHLRDGQTIYKEITADNYKWVLQATIAYPWAAPYVEHDGEKYADGSTYDSFPIEAAITLGATKVIAIDTRPSNYQDTPYGWLKSHLVFPWSRPAQRALQQRAAHYVAVRRKILTGEYGVPIYYISPESMPISTFSRDAELVRKIYRQGQVDAQLHMAQVKKFIGEYRVVVA